MKFIDLKPQRPHSDPNRSLRDILALILKVKGICGGEEDLHPTVANVCNVAVTLLEIADGRVKSTDPDALRAIMWNVRCLHNDDAGYIDVAVMLLDSVDEGSRPVKKVRLRTAARVLMQVVAHDDAVA
jgi:hypothetical protein